MGEAYWKVRVISVGLLVQRRPVPGAGRHLSRERGLLLGRKGDIREPFLHPLFLQCLQFKITNIPEWLLGGWCVPSPFSVAGHHILLCRVCPPAGPPVGRESQVMR